MAAFDEIYDYVEKDTFIRYFRLSIFIFAYLVFRKYYSNWAAKKQSDHQARLDALEKENKPEQERIAKEQELELLESESKEFGWGKKTRRNVKVTEHVLNDIAAEQNLRNQSFYNAQEDADIEELLED
ncbi:unnamed protein product [Candida verbasci]|uniref:Processing of GAS1 and ALP protein 2 n=1 Tax=Candida verbasci TaxID=1227364 RepID=A0A9W4TS16_9ASCO|nr:unnamed protein product [Candida verbasci]